MFKSKVIITGVVVALAAVAVLAVFQPTITSADASQSNVVATAEQVQKAPDISNMDKPFGGHGQGIKEGGKMEAFNKILGMQPSDIKKALQGGKTLVDIAKEKGISEDKLVASIIAQIKSNVDAKVSQGKMTKDQAAKIKNNLNADKIKADLDRVHPAGGKGFCMMQAAGQVLGMQPRDMIQALKSGKTLVDIAKGKGMSEDQLVASVIVKINSNIDARVSKGELTQDQATKMKSNLTTDRVKTDLNRVPRADGKGFGKQ